MPHYDFVLIKLFFLDFEKTFLLCYVEIISNVCRVFWFIGGWVWFLFILRFWVVFPCIPEADQNVLNLLFLICLGKNGWNYLLSVMFFCRYECVNACIEQLCLMSTYYVLGPVRVQRSGRHGSCLLGVYSLIEEKHDCTWLEGGSDHFLRVGGDFVEEVEVELVLKEWLGFWWIEFWRGHFRLREWYEQGCDGRKCKLFEEQGGDKPGWFQSVSVRDKFRNITIKKGAESCRAFSSRVNSLHFMHVYRKEVTSTVLNR